MGNIIQGLNYFHVDFGNGLLIACRQCDSAFKIFALDIIGEFAFHSSF
jgi:hypothetical protein